MESRKIIVLVEKTQRKYTFNSSATTVAELKEDLSLQGVSVPSTCIFKEARSKSTLTSPDSILPTNVPYKGTTTNELVFMMSEGERKIKSGAMKSRKELYDYIKSHNLADAVKKEYGKNYTNVTTAELDTFVNVHSVKTSSTKKETPKTSKTTTKETPCKCKVDFGEIVNATINVVEGLYDENFIDAEVYKVIMDSLNGKKVDLNNLSTYESLSEEFNF